MNFLLTSHSWFKVTTQTSTYPVHNSMHRRELLSNQKSHKAVELSVGFYTFTINTFLFTCLPQNKKTTCGRVKVEKKLLFILFHDSCVLLPAFCPSLYLKQPSLGFFCKCYILPTLAPFYICIYIRPRSTYKKEHADSSLLSQFGLSHLILHFQVYPFSCRVHDFIFSHS